MAKINIEDVKKRLQKPQLLSGSKKAKSKNEPEEITYVETINDNMFIFKVGDSYVLSPADDTLDPVIGEFDEIPEDGTMPPCMKDWLNSCSQEIEYFQQNEEAFANTELFGANNIKFVDLGLSVKWANMNLGATKSEDFGNYYAWGEIGSKDSYKISTYTYYDNTSKKYVNIGENITKDVKYDPAFVMDNNMCMPTKEQCQELIDKCTWTKTKLNDVNGWEVKGPNGNSIFIPINGCISESSAVSYKSNLYLWTASDDSAADYRAYALRGITDISCFQMYRRTGAGIRPVEVKSDIKFVDLGLSVNWAETNLGANKAEGSGDYYAWAELETKDDYSWSSYKYYVNVPVSYGNLGSNISKTQYDQAYNASKTMCLPTSEQWNELFTKCTFTEKTIDGTVGYEVKGPNGKTIFLPFAGTSYDNAKDVEINKNGYYHSGTKSSTDYQFKSFTVGINGVKKLSDTRFRTGTSIRPVATNEIDTKSTGIGFIDLGLSVKWGDKNLGATKVSDKGNYYAWGDSEANKATFSWAKYKYYTAARDESKDLGSTITQNELYDVAYAKDKSMCIPNAEQWEELINKCTWTEKTKNNVKGFEVKGPNGNTIFLPTVGYKTDKNLNYAGEQAIYTTASIYSTNVNQYRKTCNWKVGGKSSITYTRKRAGCPIRPVSSKEKENVKKSIDIMIPFKWSQSAPYSNLLPKDPSTGKTVVTGCTNTAMAMIMAYYGLIGVKGKKAKRGCSKTTAYTSNKSNIKINIPALDAITQFDYDNFNCYKTADFDTAAKKNAIATLMKYIGYASKANYSSNGTGTSVTNALTAAKNNLNLGKNATIIYMSSGEKWFEDEVYKELEQGYPVHMSGWNSSGSEAHSFICDGYNATTGKYHFNWGWSGSYNGWYNMSVLIYSTHDYSYKKRAIIGLHPEASYGDTNDDANVDINDIINIVQAILDKKTYEQKLDINADGKVDENDVIELINYIKNK